MSITIHSIDQLIYNKLTWWTITEWSLLAEASSQIWLFTSLLFNHDPSFVRNLEEKESSKYDKIFFVYNLFQFISRELNSISFLYRPNYTFSCRLLYLFFIIIMAKYFSLFIVSEWAHHRFKQLSSRLPIPSWSKFHFSISISPFSKPTARM